MGAGRTKARLAFKKKHMDKHTKQWVDDTLKQAVNTLIDRELFDDPLIEAKPEWALPPTLVIGKARPRGNPHDFVWFLCGDAPVITLPAEAAHRPRDAARHFAYQWQLQLGKDDNASESDTEKAEALYQLTELDELWQQNTY